MKLEDLAKHVYVKQTINSILPGKVLGGKFTITSINKPKSDRFLYSLFPFYNTVEHYYENTRDSFDKYQVCGLLYDFLKYKKNVALKDVYVPLYGGFSYHPDLNGNSFSQYHVLKNKPIYGKIYAVLMSFKDIKAISRRIDKNDIYDLVTEENVRMDLRSYSNFKSFDHEEKPRKTPRFSIF